MKDVLILETNTMLCRRCYSILTNGVSRVDQLNGQNGFMRPLVGQFIITVAYHVFADDGALLLGMLGETYSLNENEIFVCISD